MSMVFLTNVPQDLTYSWKVSLAELPFKNSLVSLRCYCLFCYFCLKYFWSFKDWWKSSSSFQNDPCEEYFKALMVNPILLVPPTKVSFDFCCSMSSVIICNFRLRAHSDICCLPACMSEFFCVCICPKMQKPMEMDADTATACAQLHAGEGAWTWMHTVCAWQVPGPVWKSPKYSYLCLFKQQYSMCTNGFFRWVNTRAWQRGR